MPTGAGRTTMTAMRRHATTHAGVRLAICALLLGTVVHAAQEKPAFTGQWDLINTDDTGPDVARTLRIRPTVDGRLPALIVERRLEGGIHEDRYTIGIVSGTVGGISAQGRSRDPRETRLSVTWDADRLVID